jgi:hypothetical protein
MLMDRYSSGFTLAESFYAASRFVGWEDVGDWRSALPYSRFTFQIFEIAFNLSLTI